MMGTVNQVIVTHVKKGDEVCEGDDIMEIRTTNIFTSIDIVQCSPLNGIIENIYVENGQEIDDKDYIYSIRVDPVKYVLNYFKHYKHSLNKQTSAWMH